jgi:hypothetical protein
MGLKRNAVNGWLTTILGTITVLFTLYMIYKGSLDFVWDGIIALTVGSILIVAPKTIESYLKAFVTKFTGITPVKDNDDLDEPKLKD